MAFDPDAYLNSGQPSQGGFDPDAYLGNAASAQQSPWYQRAADAIQKYAEPLGRAAARIQNTMPYVAGAINPAYGASVYGGLKAIDTTNQAAQKGGEATAEALGRHGVNPQLAAGIGTAVSMSPNLAGAFIPAPEIGATRLFEPTVPAARQAAVSAAQDLGVPLTRAEMTGSRAAAGFENMLGKTNLGSRIIQKFKDTQASKLAEAKQGLQGTMGTTQDLYGVGQQAQTNIAARDAAMNAKRDDMFNQVPENVHIPLDQAKGMADQIIQEQSQYSPTTRNGDVIAIAKDLQNFGVRPQAAGEGEYFGNTYQTPDKVIPGKLNLTETAPEPAANAPYGRTDAGDVYQEGAGGSYYTGQKTPDKTVPGKPVYDIGYSASPGEMPKAQPLRTVSNPVNAGKEPYALFNYNDNFGPNGTSRSMYRLQGDPEHPLIKQGPGLQGAGYTDQPLSWFQERGIPVVGKTTQAEKLGHEPLDLNQSPSNPPSGELPANYSQLKRMREVLGGKIQDALKNQNYVQARDYTRLKSAIDQDIQSFVAKDKGALGNMIGEEFSQRYRQANAYSGAYKNLFKSDEARALMNAPPEKIADIVFKKNNETAIKQFRALAGENGFQPVKQAFTQQLLESPNVAKELTKYKPGTLSAIYSNAELTQLRKFGLAQSLPKTASSLPGTFGSATSNVQAAQYGGLGAGVAAAASGNVPGAIAGIGQYVAPDPLARLYLGTSKGVNVPTNVLSRLAVKGGATAQPTSQDVLIKSALNKLLAKARRKSQ